MRRLLLALLLAALAATLVPASALAVPGVWVAHDVNQSANGDWMVKKHGHYSVYWALAFNDISLPDTTTYALVAKGRCTSSRDGRVTVVFCFVGGMLRKIDPSKFDFDPQLGSAHLRWQGQDVRWTGKGQLIPGGNEEADTSGVTAALYGLRDANAGGLVMGQTLRHNRGSFGLLQEGAQVDAYVTPNGTIHVGPGGRVRGKLTYKIRS
jgi:hypothetical protein